MKLLSAAQIRAWDAYTIQNEPIASHELMERASRAFTQWFIKKISKSHPILVCCGTGNNGGDGLVIARILKIEGYEVEVVAVGNREKATPDFQLNALRWKVHGELPYLESEAQLPKIREHAVVVDALFGSGLTRPIEGWAARLIEKINLSPAYVVSVDIASGLFCDQPTTKGAVIRPDYTISFQVPKKAFFFPENETYTGKWHVVDIGLHSQFLNELRTEEYVVDRSLACSWLKTRNPFSHKGTFGHVLIAAGHQGMVGAAVLSTLAALRSGAGLVTAFVPKCGYSIVQIAAPEAMCLTSNHDDRLEDELPSLEKFNTIAVGPGIGMHPNTAAWLKKLIGKAVVPLVLDADALNLIAHNKDFLDLLPKGSILTPHPGEFKRLVGTPKNDFEQVKMAKLFTQRHELFLVLKGRYTITVTPEGRCYYNTTGNPGMATGGSGDTLTGIIAGLLAQDYSSEEAAVLGVYLHGLAGDLATQNNSQEGLIASDISEFLGNAFLSLKNF